MTRRKRSRTLGRGRGTFLQKGSPSPPFPLPRLSTGGEAVRREFVPAQVGKIALRTRKPSEESSGGFCFWEGWRRGMKPSFPLEPVGGEGLLPTGKHGGRDSIRSKVFEEDGGGLEGEGETFSESFPFPPPMFYSPPSFSECSFLKMVLRLTLKTSATFWTEPCTLRALRRMPRSMSAMMSLRGRS